MKKTNILKFGMILVISILFISMASGYMYSNPKYTQFSVRDAGEFDSSMCREGTDFLVQIVPFGCTPAVVRDDLLAEQDVQVFCQLGATKINPLIKVEAIENIAFSGELPEEIIGVDFHPAKAALGVEEKLNMPVLNNIGYVVITLKQQANGTALPEFVTGNLTARISYDIESAMGIGKVSLYLPQFSDEEWEARKSQYGFWNKKGYLRLEDVGADKASIAVYDKDFKKIDSVSLSKSENSEMIHLSGMECSAGFRLRLDGLEKPGTRAKLRVNADAIEAGEKESFLNGKCEVKKIEKRGIAQIIILKCEEDDEGFFDGKEFSLSISPKIQFNIDGKEKIAEIGDYLYEDGDNSVYLGYIGTKEDSGKTQDLFAYFFTMPEKKAKLDAEELNRINAMVRQTETFGVSPEVIARFITEGEDIGKLLQGVETGIYKKQVLLMDFIAPKNKEFRNSEVAGNYANALDDYDKILESYASESYKTLELGEEALYGKILVAEELKQGRDMMEFCGEFKESYPDSARDLELCEDTYKLSSSEISTTYVMINGRTEKISFDGIYEPKLKDYSAEILVKNPEGKTFSVVLGKKEIFDLDKAEGELIQLVEIENSDAITLKVSVKGDKVLSSDDKKLETDVAESFGEYNFILKEVNLKQSARISLLPSVDSAGSEANFGFSIGIEKRLIKLAPDKIKEKIAALDENIAKLQEISTKLGKVVSGMKTACLATGTILTLSNLLDNLDGKGIARFSVMREAGGWYGRCEELIDAGIYTTQEGCLNDKADEIDKEVELMAEMIEEQNEEIKKLESKYTETNFFQNVVNTDSFMKEYAKKLESLAEQKLKTGIADPAGKGETISLEEIKENLNYTNWQDGNYDIEQIREVELYTSVLDNSKATTEMKAMAEKKLYAVFSDIKTNSQGDKDARDFASVTGMGENSLVGSLENLREIPVTDRMTLSQTKYSSSQADSSDYAFSFKDSKTREEYLILYDEDGVVTKTFSIKNGNLEILEQANPLNFFFEKYDAGAYKNKYKNPEARYYETEPYKGMPAIVPFDTDNGWYAATKPILPVLGVKAYDESGRVSSLWLCNVGENKQEENIAGDDICQQINLEKNQPYNQFHGLSEKEAEERVKAAVKAIEQASKQYKAGVSVITINVGYGVVRLKVGEPAVEVPAIQCQDVMSPKECQLMFNVCDPVICPSSRCDFGGSYPVKDVVQSGVAGSILLCAPNFVGFGGDVYVPVCLTGIQAGLDGWISIKQAGRDCLQSALDTGEMIGICDEITGVYACEFFWRQAAPLARLLIPKLLELLTGQNVRGGGEYLGVVSALETAENSLNYFTQYYGANAVQAFKARSIESAGREAFCKVAVSGVLPSGAELLDSLTKPDSPAQFHGRFDEIPFTSATVPPISQYKVFYHIYAGKDTGVYYQVYLKGSSESFYQDTALNRMVASGYIPVGEYASETKDFTAPSGYMQLCINVNGQEECGFKQVSTSFAIDYIEEQYISQQASKTTIKTEIGCVAGNAENYGIVRVCATNNPGKGTDMYYETNKSRWREVGYCDDENIKCWLDTQSIEKVIDIASIEEKTLKTLADSTLEKLKQEGSYLTTKEFETMVEEIEKQDDKIKKIELVNEIIDKIFEIGSAKPYLFLLRGNAYAELAETGKGTIKQVIEEGGTVNYEIWSIAKNYAETGYDEYRLTKEGKKDITNVCARFVTHVLLDAGIETEGLELTKTSCPLDAIDNLIPVLQESSDFAEVDEHYLNLGDVVIFGKDCELTQHAAIFSNYDATGEKIKIQTYGDGGVNDKVKLESYTPDDETWYVYKAFRYVGEGASMIADEVESPREKWTLESALDEIEKLEENKQLNDKYDKHKEFAMELVEDGLLNKEECAIMRGISGFIRGAFNTQKDMKWLKNLLLEKQADEKKANASPENSELTPGS